MAALIFLNLAACGGKGIGSSFDGGGTPESSTPQVSLTPKLANLLGLKSSTSLNAPEPISCPEVVLLEGDAAKRIYAGGEGNTNVRYQVSITDAARECAHQGEDLAIKVGVRGNVLLGPMGSPGTFNIQLRVAIFDEAEKDEIFSKLYHANVTIPAGGTQAEYTIISDILQMPFRHERADQDYAIKISLAEGNASASATPGRRKGALR